LEEVQEVGSAAQAAKDKTTKALAILLSFAILVLYLQYFLFNSQQYFSIVAMLGIVLLGALGFLLFLLPQFYKIDLGKIKGMVPVWILIVISLLLIFYEYVFSQISLPSTGQFFVALIAALISIGGIYYTEKISAKQKGSMRYVTAAICLLVIAIVIYGIAAATNWSTLQGTDESAFDAYAGTLLLHGQNPYTSSMQPSLKTYNVTPTYQANGLPEESYIYPIFSVLLTAILEAIFHPATIAFFFIITILLSLLVCATIYHKSNADPYVLIPLGLWLLLTYCAMRGVTTEYFAISLLLLLAYLYREKAIVSGVLIGLAASTLQLAWLAIPFFYVLAVREQKAAAYKLIGSSLAVFFIINIYFVIALPGMTGNMISAFTGGSFGGGSLFGPNIEQMLVSYFPVNPAFSLFSLAVFYLAFLALFYVYTDTLKPLIGLVPAVILILSSRFIILYVMAYIPLIIAAYFAGSSKAADILKSRMPIVYTLGAAGVLAIIALFYYHGVYLSSNTLSITKFVSVAQIQNGSTVVEGFVLQVHSNSSFAKNVSFYILTRDPNELGEVPGYKQGKVGADSYAVYPIQFIVPYVNGNSQAYIIAFSNDSIASTRFNIASTLVNAS
jgi:uncharacterized membrane protein